MSCDCVVNLGRSVEGLTANKEEKNGQDRRESLMAMRERRARLLPESDCVSNSKEEDDVNSRTEEKHKFKRPTDLTARDLDPPLTNYIRPLPVDVTTNILSRISGRALLNILPACKDWWSLRRNAFFIDLHLSLSVRLTPPGIILFWRGEDKGGQRYKFQVSNHLWKRQFSLKREFDPILVTPPCNGLICIYDFKMSITMCNPTTQKFMDLPRATPNSARLRNVFPKCSLGFDPVRKQFKVVRFFYRKVDHINQSYNLGCEIFTLGAAWWKSIASIGCYPTGPGVNAKDSIYWIIGSGTSNILTDKILALNITNEKFRDISVLATRSQFGGDVKESISLAQLEGNLCVVYTRFFESSTMDIWMLKDYLGKKWIHKCHIRLPVHMNDLRYKIEPIAMYDMKVILRRGRSFYEYNLQDGKTTNVYNASWEGQLLQAFSFVQSMVLLGDSS